MSSPAAVLRLAGIQAILAAAIGTALWFSYPAWRLGRVSEHLRQQYPDVAQISTSDLAAWLASANPVKPVILDVRTPEEFAAGHVPGAVNIPYDLVDERLSEIPKTDEVVLYCRSGRRAALAAETLSAAGYTKLAHLTGDMQGWTAAGLPVEVPKPAEPAESAEPAVPAEPPPAH